MQHLLKVNVFASTALLKEMLLITDWKKQMAFYFPEKYFPKKNHSNIVDKNIDS